MAPCASLSTSAFVLDDLSAGTDSSAWLSVEIVDEGAISTDAALDSASEVGTDAGEVMYEVERRVSGA